MIDKYKQLIPAPGWRCIECSYVGEQTVFNEIPIVAWALVHDSAGCEEVLPLIVLDEVFPATDARELLDATANSHVVVLGPGQELTEELKQRTAKDAQENWKAIKSAH